MSELPEDLTRLRTILYVHRGRRQAISGRQLAAILGIFDRDNRSIRESIVRLIERGCPIGSISQEGGGYFWITTPAELKACIADLDRRRHHLQKRITELEAAFGRSQVFA
jgi:predicted DNA-binding transcriptional regulator YafY